MSTTALAHTFSLPSGYHARPATLADLEPAVAMLSAASRALLGVDTHTLANWTREWTMPGWDRSTGTQLVLARLAAPRG